MSNTSSLPQDLVSAVMSYNAGFENEIAPMLEGAAAVTKIYTKPASNKNADAWIISSQDGVIFADGSFAAAGEMVSIRAARRDGRQSVTSTREYRDMERAARYPVSVVTH